MTRPSGSVTLSRSPARGRVQNDGGDAAEFVLVPGDLVPDRVVREVLRRAADAVLLPGEQPGRRVVRVEYCLSIGTNGLDDAATEIAREEGGGSQGVHGADDPPRSVESRRRDVAEFVDLHPQRRGRGRGRKPRGQRRLYRPRRPPTGCDGREHSLLVRVLFAQRAAQLARHLVADVAERPDAADRIDGAGQIARRIDGQPRDPRSSC